MSICSRKERDFNVTTTNQGLTHSIMQSSRSLLIDLPPELAYYTLSYASIIDILAIRKTCRYLKHVSHEPLIWINALRSLCHRVHVYLPSYPLDQMSALQLEQACTSWLRFQHTLCHPFNRQGLRPSQLLEHDLPHLPFSSKTLSMDCSPSSIRLVEGGRFLVTLTNDFVKLWDLHTSLCTASHSLAIPYDLFLWFELERSSKGDLIIRIRASSTSGTWFYILAVNDDHKHISLLGSFETRAITADADYFDPHRCLLAFQADYEGASYIWLWSILSRGLIRWEVKDFDPQHFLMLQGSLFTGTLQGDYNCLYQLPETLSSDEEPDKPFPTKLPPPSPPPPFLSITLDESATADIPHDSRLFMSSWTKSWNDDLTDQESLRLDLLVFTSRLDSFFIFHSRLCADHANGMVVQEHLHQGRYMNLASPDTWEVSSFTFPNETRMMWWVSSAGKRDVKFHLSSVVRSAARDGREEGVKEEVMEIDSKGVPTQNEEDSEEQLDDEETQDPPIDMGMPMTEALSCGSLHRTNYDLAETKVTLCPVSGRMCTIENGKVHIYDFIETWDHDLVYR
ncbi:hypothetical protein DL96DRAFT_17987 [Flagelloscypha sp. PMI_526]|nr:hypothetical protein DL96DRAFT_17987 [Flagelloscypha sp. PMI_526]